MLKDRLNYDVDELYQGLTRPPMLGGITETYAVIMMVFEVSVFVGLGGGTGLLCALILAPIVYAFGYLMCLRDPRTFEILRAKLQYFAAGRRRRYHWGGASFEPH